MYKAASFILIFAFSFKFCRNRHFLIETANKDDIGVKSEFGQNYNVGYQYGDNDAYDDYGILHNFIYILISLLCLFFVEFQSKAYE